MSTHAYIPGGGDDAPAQTMAPAVIVSALCHVLIFATLVYASANRPEKRFNPSVIHVNMVSLPAAADTPRAPEAPSTPPSTPAPAEEKAPAPKPVSVAPKPNVPKPKAVSLSPKRVKQKTSMKKKTYRPAQAVQKAIQRIEKQVDANKPDPIATAMDRLKAKVAATARPAPATAGRTFSGPAGPTGSGEGGGQELALIDIYRVEIAYQIQKHWAFSESLAGTAKNLSAELAFTVLPDGRIQDIWFDKRSGNRYLDDSARKAVVKSNPLPPHPAGILRPTVTVGLRFTPQGVSR